MNNTELYYRYHVRMFNYARKLLGNEEDAEDICMQVWCEYCKCPRSIGDHHMLMTMVKNTCYNKFKERQRQIKTQELTDYDIEDILVEAEVLSELYQAISELPAQMGKVIMMFYKEQKGYPEIQQLLHITKWTVKNHLMKGSAKLRDNPKLKIALNLK